MNHWPRPQDAPVQDGLADAVKIGAMRPISRGDAGEINALSTPFIKVE